MVVGVLGRVRLYTSLTILIPFEDLLQGPRLVDIFSLYRLLEIVLYSDRLTDTNALGNFKSNSIAQHRSRS